MKYNLHNLCQYLTILVISIMLPNIANANTNEPDWQFWSKQTITQAQQQNRLILIDLTAKWCMYCKKMEQTTYKDNAVIKEIQKHYIAIKADEEEYPELAKRFATVGRPGTIILDSNGNQLLAKTGYLKPQWMLWMLQGAVSELTNKKL
jgi:uncharacterized protein